MKKTHIWATAAVLAAMLGATAVQAHGIWFAQRAKQLAMIYGVGADDLDAVKRMPNLTAVEGFAADGSSVPTRLRVAGPLPLVDSDAPISVVAAAMDYGMWTKTPDGEWHAKGRVDVPDAIVAEKTMKYGVHLNSLDAVVPQIASQTLQIMPVDKVIPAEKGKPFKVRVLYKGKPQAGVSVISDYVTDPDQVPVKTAADGTATVALRNQGLNVVLAVYVGDTDNKAQYDHIEYRSSLSFVLPHQPE